MGRRKKEDLNNPDPKLNKALEGFDITINTFGEISSTLPIEKLNEFLNQNVGDRKLKNKADDDSTDNP